MTTPQDFDFDAWLDDAERPERAVTVYQKSGLIADLDALEVQIQNADDAESAELVHERRLGEMTESQRLTAEYQKLAQQFHDSALTVRVGGRSDDEKREFAKAHLELKPVDLGYAILADAISEPKVTGEQLKRFEKKVGPAQFGLILDAFKSASEDVPTVSADFLPKPSTRGDGGE